MLQLERYINSSLTQDSENSNLKARPVSKRFTYQKLLRSPSCQNSRYYSEMRKSNDIDIVNKARNRYEQLMKLFREPAREDINKSIKRDKTQKKLTPNQIKFKRHWKPRLGSQLNIQRYMFSEASPDSSPKEMKSISKTLIPIKLERYEKLGPIKRRMEEVHKNIQLDPILIKNNSNQKYEHNIIINPKKVKRTGSVEENGNFLKNSIDRTKSLKKKSLNLERWTRDKPRQRLNYNKKVNHSKSFRKSFIAGWTIKQFVQ